MFAQLTLKDMVLEEHCKADHHQENKEQETAWKQLFPGGWGQVVTSDTFINTLTAIKAEGAVKAAQKAQKKEEKAALHVMWEAAKWRWQRKREGLKCHGLKMELAGPKPQLKDMKLPGGQHMQPLVPTPCSTSPIAEAQPYTVSKKTDWQKVKFCLWAK